MDRDIHNDVDEREAVELEKMIVSVKKGREEKSHIVPACAYFMALSWWYHRGCYNFAAMTEFTMTAVLS